MQGLGSAFFLFWGGGVRKSISDSDEIRILETNFHFFQHRE